MKLNREILWIEARQAAKSVLRTLLYCDNLLMPGRRNDDCVDLFIVANVLNKDSYYGNTAKALRGLSQSSCALDLAPAKLIMTGDYRSIKTHYIDRSRTYDLDVAKIAQHLYRIEAYANMWWLSPWWGLDKLCGYYPEVRALLG